MKQFIFTIVLSLLIIIVHAQTNKVIFLQSGEKLEYSKYKLGKTNLEYVTLDGKNHSLNYDEIYFLVKRKNVMVPFEVKSRSLLKAGPLIMDLNDLDPQSSCTKGMLDAIQNTNFTGAKVGAGIGGLILPIGLVGSAVIASTPPAEQNLNLSPDAPREDIQYMECYKKTAKKQKSSQAWLGALNGVLITTTVVAILSGGL